MTKIPENFNLKKNGFCLLGWLVGFLVFPQFEGFNQWLFDYVIAGRGTKQNITMGRAW